MNFGRCGVKYHNPIIFKDLYCRQVDKRIPISLNVCGLMAMNLSIGEKKDGKVNRICSLIDDLKQILT